MTGGTSRHRQLKTSLAYHLKNPCGNGGGGMAPRRARQSCWTCKKRKIGCDRTLPYCGNCTRSGRECEGYNIRLLWPDRPDGRRKFGEIVHCPLRPGQQPPKPRYYGTQFLNVTGEDIVLSTSERDLSQLLTSPILAAPRESVTLNHAFIGQESSLLSYYQQRISSMISATTQLPNGFRSELTPTALAARDQSSMALCNAMLAVSAFHAKGSDAALPYRSNALQNLFNSLSLGDGRTMLDASEWGIIDSQIAASMILCVYSLFDESEGNGHTHIDGARYIIQRLAASHKVRFQSSFLLTWFLYHEILACLAYPLRENPRNLDLLELFEGIQGDRAVIVGPLGCSLEVIEIIHRINRIRVSILQDGVKETKHHNELAAQRLMLHHRLENLAQYIHPEEEASVTPLRRLRILSTADLYRLAASLYLLRVLPMHDDEIIRPALLSPAFSALDRLDVTTSPWPLFIIACEAVDDDARVQVLRVLERMETTARDFGSLRTMRGIVTAFWKQVDLRADAAVGPVQGRERVAHATACTEMGANIVGVKSPISWFM